MSSLRNNLKQEFANLDTILNCNMDSELAEQAGSKNQLITHCVSLAPSYYLGISCQLDKAEMMASGKHMYHPKE